MIFKLYYWFMASGANALGILLGVFIETYTDATATEIGFMYMLMPFTGIIFRPIICSYADRKRAHQKFLMVCLLVMAISYLPFVLIPFLGPDVYDEHPRFCLYFLIAFKLVGDIAFGGASSIGDSLAINYAHRIGTEYGVYRVWATISWMVFGVVTGQINEIWFLPKYVPAFMIFVSAALMNMFCVWLWPREYFVMVPVVESLKSVKSGEANETRGKKGEDTGDEKKKENVMTKSLMPKEVVWAHAKRKLLSLLTLSCFSLTDDEVEPGASAAAATTATAIDMNQLGDGCGNKKADVTAENSTSKAPSKDIDRNTQLKILFLLLKRDPRISMYAVMFICAGATVQPLSFFYMSLAGICHNENRCDFSQLGGLLQVSMASVETILFFYIKQIIATFGRLNTVSFAFALAAGKYTFYGTLWPSVNPYFSLISEIPQGVMFGIYLVLMVELAHFFANEVEFLIPELVEKGIVDSEDEENCARLKMSLSATMQALMASANDGLGRGVGALIYGLILDRYSFHTLWLIIGAGSTVLVLIIQSINIFDRCVDPKLGLDVQFEKNMSAEAAVNNKLAVLMQDRRSLHECHDTISIHSNRSKLQLTA